MVCCCVVVWWGFGCVLFRSDGVFFVDLLLAGVFWLEILFCFFLLAVFAPGLFVGACCG